MEKEKIPLTIQECLKRKFLVKDAGIIRLNKNYLLKAKNNLATANILFSLQSNQKVREILSIPMNYSSDDWVIITSYYAMYAGALSLLAKIGYKSSNHSATILALEKFYVEKQLIEREFLSMLNYAKITKEEIQELTAAKDNREIAQYSVTKATTSSLAEISRNNAFKFIEKVERIIIGV